MNDSFERFDMTSPPVRTRWFLRPLTYLLSLPDVLAHKVQIHYEGTKELKPPFLLLSNHNAFMDFKVLTKAIFPRRANYVVAIDGFIGREWLLRNVGCLQAQIYLRRDPRPATEARNRERRHRRRLS